MSPEDDHLQKLKYVDGRFQYFPRKRINMLRHKTNTFMFVSITLLYKTWNHSGILSVICPIIRMCEEKHSEKNGIIYTTNEEHHITIKIRCVFVLFYCIYLITVCALNYLYVCQLMWKTYCFYPAYRCVHHESLQIT